MSLLYKHNQGSLHQCGKREIPGKLHIEPISLLILAAKDYQPHNSFEHVDKILVPLTDSSALSSRKLRKTIKAAEEIADHATKHIEDGGHVLSTCMAGWNRSGLISGIIIQNLTGAPGKDIVRHIRNQRSVFALSNPLFAKYIIQRR